MMYIDKSGKLCTNEITIKERESVFEKYGFFECDELIAPTIQVLLKKGYTTTYCCQSHFRRIQIADPAYAKDNDGIIGIRRLKIHHNYAYISFAINDLPYPPPEEDGWVLKYCIRREDADGNLITGFQQNEPFKKCPFYNCKDSESIVLFVKLLNKLESLNDCANTFEYNAKLLPIMKRLYRWALSLPYRSAIEYN